MRRAAALLCCLLLAGCGGPVAELGATPTDADSPTPTNTDTPTQTATDSPTAHPATPTPGTPDRVASILASGRAAVAIGDANGTRLAVVNASVADTRGERTTGLSEATALANGSGMLFVFDGEARRSFVMRGMAFPLDVVFVGANGTITAIHHAPVEDDDDLTQYTGTARWVVEVPYGWTTRRGIDVGDAVSITHPTNGTDGSGTAGTGELAEPWGF